MELKRIVASDSNTALKSVKDECGDDALIVSTNKIGQKTEVIYAVEGSMDKTGGENHATPQSQITPANTRFSDSIDEELLGEKEVERTKDMNLLLSEIQKEIQSLRLKLDSSQKDLKSVEMSNSVLKISEQSVRRRLEAMSQRSIEEQGPWSGLNILVSLKHHPDSRLLKSIIGALKKSEVDEAKIPVLSSVREPHEAENFFNKKLLDFIDAAHSTNVQLLMSPGLEGLSSFIQHNDPNSPILLSLCRPSQTTYEKASKLLAKFPGRMLFAIDCDQTTQSIAEDLSKIPEQSRSLMLYSRRKDITSADLIRQLASSTFDISRVICSLEERISQ